MELFDVTGERRCRTATAASWDLSIDCGVAPEPPATALPRPLLWSFFFASVPAHLAQIGHRRLRHEAASNSRLGSARLPF